MYIFMYIGPDEDMNVHAGISGSRQVNLFHSLYVVFDYALIFADRLHKNHMRSWLYKKNDERLERKSAALLAYIYASVATEKQVFGGTVHSHLTWLLVYIYLANVSCAAAAIAMMAKHGFCGDLRESGRSLEGMHTNIYVHMCVYIYIYTHTTWACSSR